MAVKEVIFVENVTPFFLESKDGLFRQVFLVWDFQKILSENIIHCLNRPQQLSFFLIKTEFRCFIPENNQILATILVK